jgi:hypothetical protein
MAETSNVSATGAFLVADRPLLVSAPVEYVLTFPPDLTKVPNLLRVRFFGKVLRCERIPVNNSAFGIGGRQRPAGDPQAREAGARLEEAPDDTRCRAVHD